MKKIYSPFALTLSAFFTGLAQHPIQLGWLAWFSLIPLIFVLNRIDSIKHFIITGLIWGLVYFITVIFWLANNIGTTQTVGFISMLAAISYCSFNIIIICLVTKVFKKYYPTNWFWSLPLIWVAIEYIRHQDILSGGPWTSLANSQIDFITLAQNVEITGIYGISFWIVIINILLFNWLVRPYSENLFKYIVIFIFPWITGYWLSPNIKVENEKPLDVAVIQPNIHQSQKWKTGGAHKNILSLINDSKSVIKDNVELIIWPETSTSAFILQGSDYYLKLIQNELGSSNLISGIPYYDDEKKERRYYNSAVHIVQDSVKDIYHKLILVPMGEYIPLADYYPSLKKFNLGQGNFTSGLEYTIMNVDNIKCATMICFESTLPKLNRKFVLEGAEVLIYIVNDGWYENPPQPQQHAKQVIYRAIENRRPIIRCANTGISMIVDYRGNIINKLQLNQKGVIRSSIYPKRMFTFYTKYGDIFAQLNIIICIFFIVKGIVRKI